MGLVRQGRYIPWNESAYLSLGFPHVDLIQEKTTIDVPKLVYSLLGQQLLRRDSTVTLGNSVLRLSDLTHPTGRKRFDKNAPNSVIPKSDETSELNFNRQVSKEEVASLLDDLNVRKEKSAVNQIVIKSRLKSLVQLLDKMLASANPNQRDWSYCFEVPAERHKVIAAWVNWLFAYKYKIKSTYTQEQIRQLFEK